MKLSETDPRFLGTKGEKLKTMPAEGFISMLCPKCLRDNPSGAGVHRIVLPYGPNPECWHATGDSVETFTFVPPGNVSVRVIDGCEAHFLIANGEITFV